MVVDTAFVCVRVEAIVKFILCRLQQKGEGGSESNSEVMQQS